MNLEYASLSQMRGEVGRLVGSESSNFFDGIDDALNRGLDAAAGMGWKELQRSDESGLRSFAGTAKSMIAGDPFLPGPFGVTRLRGIRFREASGDVEIIEDTELFSKASSSIDSTGLPRYAAYVGTTAQHLPFTDPSFVTLTCVVATNNNSKILRVDYDKLAGYAGGAPWEDVDGLFSAGVALNSRSKAPYGVRRLMVPTGWAGGITLSTSADGTIGEIPTLEEPGTNTNNAYQLVARPLYRLWPVPDTDYACTLTWTRSPARLTEDEDIPELPISSFLVLTAAADIFRSVKNNAAMADVYERKASAILRELKNKHVGYQRMQAIPARGSFVGQNDVC